MSKYKKVEGFSDDEWGKIDEFNREIFDEFLEQGHLSDATLVQYESGLRIFFTFVYDRCQNKPLHKLRARDALRFQNYLISLGLSSSSIKFKRSSVSSLCNFVELYYGEDYPDFRNIYSKAIPSVENTVLKEKIPLTTGEIKQIKKVLRQREEWQRLAFFLVAYSTAGRRAEIIQLKKEIIDYPQYKNKKGEAQNFHLSHNIRGKGRGVNGKPIKLMVSTEAMDAVRKWLEYRGEDDCEYIFASMYKGKYRNISVNTINNWVNYFGDIIDRKINPHLIRVTRSTDIVVNDGKDVRFAQKLLNHESSETTNKHYVIRDESDDLGELFD